MVAALTPPRAVLPIYVATCIGVQLTTDYESTGRLVTTPIARGSAGLLIVLCLATIIAAVLARVPRCARFASAAAEPLLRTVLITVTLLWLATAALEASRIVLAMPECGCISYDGGWVVAFGAVFVTMMLPMHAAYAIAAAIALTGSWIIGAAIGFARRADDSTCRNQPIAWGPTITVALYTAYYCVARISYGRTVRDSLSLQRHMARRQRAAAAKTRRVLAMVRAVFTPHLVRMAIREALRRRAIVDEGSLSRAADLSLLSTSLYFSYLHHYLGPAVVVRGLLRQCAAPADTTDATAPPSPTAPLMKAGSLAERIAGAVILAVDMRTLREASMLVSPEDVLALMAAVVHHLDAAVSRYAGARVGVLGTVFTAVFSPYDDAAIGGGIAVNAVTAAAPAPPPTAGAGATGGATSPVGRASAAVAAMAESVRRLSAVHGVAFDLVFALDTGVVTIGMFGMRFVSQQALGTPLSSTERLVLRPAALANTLYLTDAVLEALRSAFGARRVDTMLVASLREAPPLRLQGSSSDFASATRMPAPRRAWQLAAAHPVDATAEPDPFAPLVALWAVGSPRLPDAATGSDLARSRSSATALPSPHSGGVTAISPAASQSDSLLAAASLQHAAAESSRASSAMSAGVSALPSPAQVTAANLGHLISGSGGGGRAALTWRDFKLLRGLGSGHFATVYLALHRGSRNLFAIKVIDTRQSKSKSLQAELKALAAPPHPQLVEFVCALNGPPNEVWLVQEYVQGCTLEAMIEPDRVLDEATVLRLVVQVARAIGHLHSLGIVHRDIKPANIMITLAGHVKLLDLGLAAVISLPAPPPAATVLAPASPSIAASAVSALSVLRSIAPGANSAVVQRIMRGAASVASGGGGAGSSGGTPHRARSQPVSTLHASDGTDAAPAASVASDRARSAGGSVSAASLATAAGIVAQLTSTASMGVGPPSHASSITSPFRLQPEAGEDGQSPAPIGSGADAHDDALALAAAAAVATGAHEDATVAPMAEARMDDVVGSVLLVDAAAATVLVHKMAALHSRHRGRGRGGGIGASDDNEAALGDDTEMEEAEAIANQIDPALCHNLRLFGCMAIAPGTIGDAFEVLARDGARSLDAVVIVASMPTHVAGATDILSKGRRLQLSAALPFVVLVGGPPPGTTMQQVERHFVAAGAAHVAAYPADGAVLAQVASLVSSHSGLHVSDGLRQMTASGGSSSRIGAPATPPAYVPHAVAAEPLAVAAGSPFARLPSVSTTAPAGETVDARTMSMSASRSSDSTASSRPPSTPPSPGELTLSDGEGEAAAGALPPRSGVLAAAMAQLARGAAHTAVAPSPSPPIDGTSLATATPPGHAAASVSALIRQVHGVAASSASSGTAATGTASGGSAGSHGTAHPSPGDSGGVGGGTSSQSTPPSHSPSTLALGPTPTALQPQPSHAGFDAPVRIADVVPDVITSVAGTPLTMAPEVYKRRSGLASDWWSLGVVAFRCLAGDYPHPGTNKHQLRLSVLGDVVTWDLLPHTVSASTRDLLRQLMLTSPSQRLGGRGGVDEVLAHPALAPYVHAAAVASEAPAGAAAVAPAPPHASESLPVFAPTQRDRLVAPVHEMEQSFLRASTDWRARAASAPTAAVVAATAPFPVPATGASSAVAAAGDFESGGHVPDGAAPLAPAAAASDALQETAPGVWDWAGGDSAAAALAEGLLGWRPGEPAFSLPGSLSGSGNGRPFGAASSSGADEGMVRGGGGGVHAAPASHYLSHAAAAAADVHGSGGGGSLTRIVEGLSHDSGDEDSDG